MRILGGLAAFGGVMMLLTLIPFFHSRFQPFGKPIGPLWFRVTGHLVTMVVGLLLLFLAGQVARGKRRAWQICTAFFLLGVVTNMLKGPHPISAAYCAVLAVALLSLPPLLPGALGSAVAAARWCGWCRSTSLPCWLFGFTSLGRRT